MKFVCFSSREIFNVGKIIFSIVLLYIFVSKSWYEIVYLIYSTKLQAQSFIALLPRQHFPYQLCGLFTHKRSIDIIYLEPFLSICLSQINCFLSMLCVGLTQIFTFLFSLDCLFFSFNTVFHTLSQSLISDVSCEPTTSKLYLPLCQVYSYITIHKNQNNKNL